MTKKDVRAAAAKSPNVLKFISEDQYKAHFSLEDVGPTGAFPAGPSALLLQKYNTNDTLGKLEPKSL